MQLGGLAFLVAASYVAFGKEHVRDAPRSRKDKYIVKSDSGECHYYGFWECTRRGGDCEQLLQEINDCVAAKWAEAKQMVGHTHRTQQSTNRKPPDNAG